MCWSGEASAVLATIGLGSTVYAAYKKEPMVLCMALGYFSLMELLQAFTYSVINECALPSNQIATLLGYLHIAFQPFFINAVSLHFINQNVAKRIAPAAYTLCFIVAITMILQVYPFDWAGICTPGRILCSTHLCSVSGNWHIAWDLPLNGIGNSLETSPYWVIGPFMGYTLIGFLVPLFYGSWRFTVYHMLVGPLLARATTSNMNEWPAVWCLLSIGLLLLVVKTPLRNLLYVKSWVLWPKKWMNS
ncbi:MAG: hypothetical protein EBR02_05630 [Alphaproteobacteria bacterium]|nr:hypothetical protein [Alphaproteobacteria bacterium]